MSTIDNRVVQMQFDNKQFEANIKTSTQSLDNLKKGLNLDESAKSLTNLEKVAKTFTLQGISEGVNNISEKFTALGIVGVTALANITNSAVNAGKSLLSALTIDPIKTGFQEYETKMNAIQTILTNTASKGTKMADVTAALNELNTYADLTIYNFAEMARNIGTFTAAGVDLKTSVASIKGIANLAAGSGSSALQASTAMYQLSQAIAAGSVKLQDWNSVVNAGMGGELFQKALEKTAKSMGHGRNMAVSFRDSLQDGWITTKVLTKTLEQFANDKSLIQAATQVKTLTQLLDTMKESVQSGWAQTWETIVGNRDEAAVLFTNLNNAFGAIAGSSANARNNMLDFWKANGGRDAVIKGITNIFTSLGKVLGAVQKAWREVFPPETGMNLVKISKGFEALTEKLKIGDGIANNIKVTFKGLFSILDIALLPIKLVAGGIGLIINALTGRSFGLVEGLTSATATVGNFLTYLDDLIKKNDIIGKAMTEISKGIAIASKYISIAVTDMTLAFNQASMFIGPKLTDIKNNIITWATALRDSMKPMTVFAEGLGGTKQVFSEATNQTDNLKLAFDKLSEGLSRTKDFFVSVKNGIVVAAKAIWSVLGPVLDSIKKKFDSLSMNDVGSILTGAGLLFIGKELAKGIKTVTGMLGTVKDIMESFKGILDEVGNSLKAFQLKVKADALMKVAIALGILAAALIAMSFIDIAKLGKSLGVLTVLMVELVGALTFMNKKIKTVQKVTGQLIALGVAMLLLAESVRILSSIKPAQLINGVGALSTLLMAVAAFIKLTAGGDLKASASGLIGFSIGITILAGALAILGKLKPQTLIQGTVAIAALMTTIAAFINLTKGGDLAASSGGIVGFAIGLTILAGALTILGKLKYEQLMQGTVAIAGLMAMIGVFINVTKGGDLAASAGGLIGFSIGILIMSKALSTLGKLDTTKLIQGGVAIAALMTLIANFIMVTNGGDLAKSAAGLIGFAIGIMIITKALDILGKLDTGKVVQGTVAISALMTVIANFINVTRGGDLAASAGGLIGFSVGITILAAAVTLISKIDSGKAAQGVIVIMALISTIALFTNLTKGGDLANSAKGIIGFSTGIMILAGVIAILSALDTKKLIVASTALAVLLTTISVFVHTSKGGDLQKTSAGLIGFSIGVGILAAALVALAQIETPRLLAAGLAISALIISIGGFVKLSQGGNLIVSAAGLVLFAGGIMVLVQVLKELGSMDIKTLAVGIGSLAGIMVILGLTAFALAPLSPVILTLAGAIALFGIACLAVGTGMMLFAQGLNALAASGSSGMDALTGVVTGLINLIPLALSSLALGLINFIKTIGDNAPVVADAFMKILNSIIDTIVIMAPKIITSLGILVNSFINFLVEEIPFMVDAGMKLILGILTGISNNIEKVTTAGINVILGFINGVSSKLPAIIDTAFKVIISFINGLADAIRNNHNAIYNAVGNLISAIVGAIGDGVWKLQDAGVNLVLGFIKGIKSQIQNAADWAGSLANSVIASAKKVLGIHSPSKEFESIGVYSILGLVNALRNKAGLAADAAKNVGNMALNSLSNAISGMSDVLSGNIDMNPTIRPVLDLSDIQNGSKQINGLMSNLDGYSMNGTINAANMAATGFRNNQAPSNGTSGDTINNNGGETKNIFYITGNNPDEIADAVSRKLQKQVDRRDAVWA